MDKLLYKRKQQSTIQQDINQENSPLQYCGLKVLAMKAGDTYSSTNQGCEVCIVPVEGTIQLQEGDFFLDSLGTRKTIFDKQPTDSVYISNGKSFTITCKEQAKVAVCSSRATQELPTRIIKRRDVIVEDRGKYANQRHVLTILGDEDEVAQHLLVVEVYTEGGNWSSYPPHKHDVENYPNETFLEEIYYHEQSPPNGFVFQRVYTEDRQLDETMTIESGDAVIVPKGYHPVAVPDGYTSYYLNVMAGPVRKWKFHNEQAHEWILARD